MFRWAITESYLIAMTNRGCKAGYVPGGAEGRCGAMGMDMVTKGVHNVIEFLSDDSPDMDVIGISGEFLLYVIDNFFSDINKPAAVNCIEGHDSSLGRFKSHASNIVFDEHSENILPSSEGDVGLAASSGPSVLGDKVDEECAAADPPEISDAQNNRKCCRE
ncbi:hypothetical protein Bca4012_080242 [Brassica carinata]